MSVTSNTEKYTISQSFDNGDVAFWDGTEFILNLDEDHIKYYATERSLKAVLTRKKLDIDGDEFEIVTDSDIRSYFGSRISGTGFDFSISLSNSVEVETVQITEVVEIPVIVEIPVEDTTKRVTDVLQDKNKIVESEIIEPDKYLYTCVYPDGLPINQGSLTLLSTAKGYILDDLSQLMSEGFRYCGKVPLNLEQIAQIQQQLKKPEDTVKKTKFRIKIDPTVPIPARVHLKDSEGNITRSIQPKRILISNRELVENAKKLEAKQPKEKEKENKPALDVNRILAGSSLAENRKLRSYATNQTSILEELAKYSWLASREMPTLEKALSLNFTEKPLAGSVEADTTSPIKLFRYVMGLLPYKAEKKEDGELKNTLERKIEVMLSELTPEVEDWIIQHPLRLLSYAVTEFVGVRLRSDSVLQGEVITNLEGLPEYQDNQIEFSQVTSISISRDENQPENTPSENVIYKATEKDIPNINRITLKPLIRKIIRVVELSTKNFNPALSYQNFNGELTHSASKPSNTVYNASAARLKYMADLDSKLVDRNKQDNKRKSSYLKNSSTKGIESIGILANLPDFLWCRIPRSADNPKSGFYMGIFPRCPQKELTVRIPIIKRENSQIIESTDSKEVREAKIQRNLDFVSLKAEKFKKDTSDIKSIMYVLESVKYDKFSKTATAILSKNGTKKEIILNTEVCKGKGFTRIDTFPDPHDMNRKIELSIGRFVPSNVIADIRVSDTPWLRESWVTIAQIDTQPSEKNLRMLGKDAIHCFMSKTHRTNIVSHNINMTCLIAGLAKLGMQPRRAISPSTLNRAKNEMKTLNWNQPIVQNALGIQLERDSDHNVPYKLIGRMGVGKSTEYTLKLSYLEVY